MSEQIVWKGLAHVLPRPNAEFSGLGACVDVVGLAADEDECFAAVASAMDDHECELLEAELEPLERALEADEDAAERREIAAEQSREQAVWCEGTFYIYENEDEDA